jgi:hypothetical protein
MEKIVIGRRDKADFPKLGFKNVDIKVDTGAYTSSIHCTNIKEDKGGLIGIFFDPAHPNYDGRKFHFKEYNVVFVKSSNGEIQQRYEIQSNIVLFKKTFKISLTLSAREDMRFPVLLGRKFITKKFIVDTELIDVSHNLEIDEYKNTFTQS